MLSSLLIIEKIVAWWSVFFPQQTKSVYVEIYVENSLEMLTFHKELKIEEINSTNTGPGCSKGGFRYPPDKSLSRESRG